MSGSHLRIGTRADSGGGAERKAALRKRMMCFRHLAQRFLTRLKTKRLLTRRSGEIFDRIQLSTKHRAVSQRQQQQEQQQEQQQAYFGQTERLRGTQQRRRSSISGLEDPFEMWDYIYPQYLRPAYANEWV